MRCFPEHRKQGTDHQVSPVTTGHHAYGPRAVDGTDQRALIAVVMTAVAEPPVPAIT
jgi:hypothetical protein